jgi:uroporphyrinogen-III decarboxylase
LKAITPPPYIWEIVGFSGSMIPFGLPAVQQALKALMEAGSEALSWIQRVMQFDLLAKRKGFPTLIGGASKAPYDVLADTLRGTQGMMLDLYRRPEMVQKAMERLLPIYVQQGVDMANVANNPMVFIPLHKGADGFLSDRQFATFYWPTLKALLIGLINQGCIPMVFCEGSFDSRLQYFDEIPPGTTYWQFDRTDLVNAKSSLGKRHCIGGNVPAGLLLTGSEDDVKAYCKGLIDRLAPGGGYVLCNGTAMDEGEPVNLHAMIDYSREYGVYPS